jgi:hypothetical protein
MLQICHEHQKKVKGPKARGKNIFSLPGIECAATDIQFPAVCKLDWHPSALHSHF